MHFKQSLLNIELCVVDILLRLLFRLGSGKFASNDIVHPIDAASFASGASDVDEHHYISQSQHSVIFFVEFVVICCIYGTYLHSLLIYHTHILYALQTLTCCLLLVSTLPLSPVALVLQIQLVWNSLPSDIHHSSSTDTFHRLLKTQLTASSRPLAPPCGSPKCLRLGHQLTVHALKI